MIYPRTFYVFGGGGHGKVVADIIRAVGGEIAGYVERDQSKLGVIVEPGGATVVAFQDDLLEFLERRHRLPGAAEAVALAVGAGQARLELLETIGDALCPALIHPSAVISPSATIGPGTVVLPGAIVNASAVVGRAVIINSGAVVEHDCQIGDGVHISPNATVCGSVSVGALSWIGAGSTVIQGIRVGHEVIVGAGAVVIRTVADGITIVGNPGRILHNKFNY
ncbi:MAG: acetyltransferase [Bradymonadaceae bacterium]|nr:acetyltransferase [Lujinxingiaceae bacterium]